MAATNAPSTVVPSTLSPSIEVWSSGRRSAPVVGCVLLGAGCWPEIVGFVPSVMARRVVGPADDWRGGPVGDGDDGRRTRAVVILVGMNADGSCGQGEARIAGIDRWLAGWQLMVGQQDGQPLEQHR